MKRPAIANKNQSELNAALLQACKKNSYQGVMDALNAGADILAKDNKGRSAWKLVENKRGKFFGFFKGAKKALEPSVYLENAGYYGRIGEVKKLLKDNNNISKSALTRTLMSTAIKNDTSDYYVEGSHEEICKLLLKKGANPDFTFNKSNKTANSLAQKSYSMKTVFDKHYKEKNLKVFNKFIKTPENKKNKHIKRESSPEKKKKVTQTRRQSF